MAKKKRKELETDIARLRGELALIKKEIMILSRSILKYCDMPKSGNAEYKSDIEYLAEAVAPQAQNAIDKYSYKGKQAKS